MENLSCSSCQKTQAPLTCGICHCRVCKNCVQFVDEDQFAFSTKTPQEFLTFTFCQTCYSQKVLAEIERYEQTLEKAKAIDVFQKKQIKETRFLKRKEKPYRVVDCNDREEALLRLAFFAAEAGFNALIDVELDYKKVTQNKYHTTKWSGTAIPVNLNPNRLVKDRSTWENPN